MDKDLKNLVDIEKDIITHPESDIAYVDKLFKHTSLKESDIAKIRQAYSIIMSNPKLSDEQKKDLSINAWKVNFTSRPPTPTEFLTEAWIGGTAKRLYPYISGWFNDFFDFTKPYRNAIFYLPIGSGKSTLAVLMNLYLASHYYLMRDPRNFFNQTESSVMTMGLIAFNQDKAYEILVKPMMNIMETSKKFSRCRDKARLRKMMDEGDNNLIYWTTAGQASVLQIDDLRFKQISDVGNLLGLTMLMGTATELTFFKEKGWSDERIMRLYNDIRGRIHSRLPDNYYARSILDSSPDCLENSIDRWIVNESQEDETNYLLRGTKWDLQPQLFEKWNKNKLLTFRMFKGSASKPTKVLDEKDDISEYDDRDIIDVPIDILQLAKNDPSKTLKDYAGIPTGMDDKLIPNIETIENIFTPSLTNIYSYIHVPAPLPPEELIWDRIKNQFFIKINNDLYEFYRNPHAVRFISVDQSEKNDWTGISCCHVERNKKGELVYVVDFSICIAPTKEKINLEAIKYFITDLRKYGKINIHSISFDQFQSSSTIQYLERMGFKVVNLSVDRTTEPYLNFISAMQRSCVKVGKNIVLKNNLKSLIMSETKIAKRKKIDHTNGDIVSDLRGGDWNECLVGRNMKDLSDSVVASVYLADMYGSKSPEYIWEDVDTNANSMIQLRKNFLKGISKKYKLGVV